MDPDDPSGSQPPADDLQEIEGIGRGLARRLQDAGVRTFAEVAGHTPAELAAKAAVPTSRVTRERWIPQARVLAERSAVADGDDPGTADAAERRESFVLRLTLDEDGRVGRTSVTHVRSGQEAPPWAGWDTARLLGFLSGYVDLSERPRPTPGPRPAGSCGRAAR